MTARNQTYKQLLRKSVIEMEERLACEPLTMRQKSIIRKQLSYNKSVIKKFVPPSEKLVI